MALETVGTDRTFKKGVGMAHLQANLSSAAQKILFVSHDASRTGVPMTLLTLMRWLHTTGNAEMALLLAGEGELLPHFKKIAPVQVIDLSQLKQSLTVSFKADVVYYNGVYSAMIFQSLAAGQSASICHVHELEYAIQTLSWPKKHPDLFGRFDRVVACANAVRDNLVGNRAVPAERIDVVHEFVPHALISACANAPGAYEKVRTEMNLSPNALIVSCVASCEWRKGPDLFVQLAHAVVRRCPELPVVFVWVGGSPHSHDTFRFNYDQSRLPDLKGRIFCLPPQSDPSRFFAGMDIFVLPSREDPFPLVCLEAAACGKPIVCFDKAGGMPELVRDDAGVVVPYLDLDAMADAVIRLLRDPQVRKTFGEAASQRVRDQHDVSVCGAMILQSIERAIAGSTR